MAEYRVTGRIRRNSWPLLLLAMSVPLAACSSGPQGSANVSPQGQLQVRITHDEQALDRGALTYRRPPPLRTGQPATLTVSVTDLGPDPAGTVTARAYARATD